MKKILVIEDDPVMGVVCQRLLGRQGFTIELASDGIKGLEVLNTFRPDAVLLDMMMPKKSGLDVLKEIRAQEAFRNLPVIVLTNACVPTVVDQASKAGATHILDKSKFNPVAITELLRGLLDIKAEPRVGLMSQTERVDRLH